MISRHVLSVPPPPPHFSRSDDEGGGGGGGYRLSFSCVSVGPDIQMCAALFLYNTPSETKKKRTKEKNKQIFQRDTTTESLLKSERERERENSAGRLN